MRFDKLTTYFECTIVPLRLRIKVLGYPIPGGAGGLSIKSFSTGGLVISRINY
jgi:hypothetical protein